nr:probable pectate lyase 16 [Ipomoea batatas]
MELVLFRLSRPSCLRGRPQPPRVVHRPRGRPPSFWFPSLTGHIRFMELVMFRLHALCLEVDRTRLGSSAGPRGRPPPYSFPKPTGSYTLMETCVRPSRLSASRSTAPPRGRRGLEVDPPPLGFPKSRLDFVFWFSENPHKLVFCLHHLLVHQGRPHRLGVVRGLEAIRVGDLNPQLRQANRHALPDCAIWLWSGRAAGAIKRQDICSQRTLLHDPTNPKLRTIRLWSIQNEPLWIVVRDSIHDCKLGKRGMVPEEVPTTLENRIGLMAMRLVFLQYPPMLCCLDTETAYTADRVMKVTVVFNHFGRDLVQRMPRVRHGYAHVSQQTTYDPMATVPPLEVAQVRRY